MSRIVPAHIVRKVRARAHGLCEYCKLSEALAAGHFAIDHIVARQHRGTDSLDNLAWACVLCNSLKSTNIASTDPDSNEPTLLFHPRKDNWHAHFSLKEGVVVGKTPQGRATLSLLNMNDPESILYRRIYFNSNPLP